MRYRSYLAWIVALVGLLDLPAAGGQAFRFSPQAQATVELLGSFGDLPANDWEYCEGMSCDAGGRAVWRSVTIPFVGSRESVRLRRSIEVPPTLNGYDLTGAKLAFAIEVGRDGPGRGYLFESIYVDGKRVAEGTHLPKITLRGRVSPKDRLLVEVRMPATKDTKHFGHVEFSVETPPGRPDPTIVRTELLAGAELLPVFAPDAAARHAAEELLETAANAVDTGALRQGKQAAFDASLNHAHALLMPLQAILRKGAVRMVGNAHIDAAWLWTASETVDQVHFTFENALRLMEEFPDFRFSQSAAQYYEWMQQKFPEVFAQMKREVQAGRWEPVGGMWIEPDLNMPDGEAIVRQLLLGTRYFKRELGYDIKVGWNPDSFGFNWQLPQIYKKSGIDFFLTQKLHYNESNLLPLRLFWWQSPDGSRVLTYFPHDYVQDVEPDSIAKDLAQYVREDPGQTEMMHLYGPSLGRLALAQGRTQLDEGARWAKADKVFPHIKFSTALSFFGDMAPRVEQAQAPVWNYRTFAAGETKLPVLPGKISVPVWNDELYLELHRGTYTSQAAQKANMRRSEEELLNAEKYSSLAWLQGLAYPGGPFTQAWKRKSFNDFHDVAAGSSIAQVYRDAQQDYDVIGWTARQATRNALGTLEQSIDTGRVPGVPVIVWNPLSWARTDVVEAHVQLPVGTQKGIAVLDDKGHPVAVQVLALDQDAHTYDLLIEPRDVPSIGYTVLHAVPGGRRVESDLRVAGTTMENQQLRVTVDATTGCITSLYDKAARFESIAAGQCGNLLQAFVDAAPVEDAWNIPADFEKSHTDLTTVKSVEVLERGPLRAVIRVTREWSHSRFVQDITLYAHLPRVEVRNDIDWHETQVLLKASFPLAAASGQATYEIPYGAIERPTTRSNSVEQAKFEVPALRWADLGDGQHGLSLINDSKYGYDAKDNVLRLSLLRSPTYPDPDADRGIQRFRYALYPHAGTWKEANSVRRGYEFNYGLQAEQVVAHEGSLPSTHSFVQLEPANLILTAMKKSEDTDSLTLRFYEWAGQETTAELRVPVGSASARETNLMEQPTEASADHFTLSGDHVRFHVGPYSINTVQVDYPETPAKSSATGGSSTSAGGSKP